MDHFATPSPREADPRPIVKGELANISQPYSTPRPGIPMPLSNSSELDRVSGTLDNISRDEDAEPITTVGEYCGALSKTGSVSSRTRKSLSSSDRSILFAPSYGVLTMTLHELVEYLQSKDSLSEMNILDMTIYRSKSLLKHKFVVLRLTHGWLRLDRRVANPFNPSFIFSSMQGLAKDEVYHTHS